MLSNKSIRYFVAAKTAPWIALFLVFVGLAILFIEQSIFTDKINGLHQQRINHFVENKSRVLDSLLDQVNTIAANDLVVNGLVDEATSENYLVALIDSYSLSGTKNNSIKIVDLHADVIFSNQIEISALNPREINILNIVIDTTIGRYDYTDNGVVFISPILWRSKVEGAIVVEIPFQDLNELFSVDVLDGEIISFDKEHSILFSTNADLANEFLSFSDAVLDIDNNNSEKFNEWYFKRYQIGEGGYVYSFEKSESIRSKLYWFVVLGITSLVIAFSCSLISIFLSSFIISRTLNQLLSVLKAKKEGGSAEVEISSSGNDPEELARIYQNFDALLDDLTRSESFGNDIQSIINSLSECLVVFDMNGEVSLSNLSFQRFNNSVVGNESTFKKIIPKILQSKALSVEASMKDFECVYAISSGNDIDADKEKNERVIRWSRSLYLEPTNAVAGLTFIGVDVTDAKAVEKDIKQKNKAIQDLSQRFNLALEAAVIGVWEFNVDENHLIWDDRMHEVHQIPKEEFSGTINDWIACVHPQDFEVTNEILQKSILTGDDFFANYRIIWPNKEIRWLSSNARVINEEGALRVVGANIDITETKRLNEDLEGALKKAEELVKIKSDFLASMSHEIRTPMNGVLGMLKLLKRTQLSLQQNRYTELAYSSAESLLALIDDILDFSKVDSGKLELEYIDFNLPDTLGELAEAMAHRAQDKGLELILDIADIETDFVNGDPSRLRQIFTNLVGNAIKFTEQGEILITASIEPNPTGGLVFKGSVKDTGIGIPENKIESLFDSFSQVDASTTRKYGGTGLGLSIVKQLCMQMNGDITIDSQLGQGSEFVFNLILGKAEELDDDAPISDRTNIDLEGVPIMVIEDNLLNANVLKRQLVTWGAKTSVFHTIDDSLDQLRQDDLPKLILIDADMAVMNGLAFAQYLRSDRCFNDVKIVLMSAITSIIHADDLKNLGSTTSLPKPATRNNLLTVLLSDTQVFDKSISKSAALKPSAQPFEKVSSNNRVLRDTRILLVEDNLINQEVALGILNSLELTADVAENGLSAINILNQKQYDLILMDCQMPEMDGYATTRAIRSGKTLQPTIPIIAMTANAMKGDKEKCLTAGMDDYLSKPIDPQQLVKKLDEWSLPQAKENCEDEVSPLPSITDNHENAIIWDRSNFMHRIMNNEILAHKLVNLFKVDTPKTIDELGVAVDTGHAGEAGLLAHKLKGTVSNLGGIELADLAYKIEQAGREDDINSIKHLWPMIRPKYDQLLQQIERGL